MISESGYLTGFSYRLPSKSYAIFHLPSPRLSPTSNVNIHHHANNLPIPPPQIIEDEPPPPVVVNVPKQPVLDTDPFLADLPPTSVDYNYPPDVVNEQGLLDIELQRVPSSEQNPLLLNLPPLMSPEILHNSEFPEIDLQKVPALGETNYMAIEPPPTRNQEDVDLKFFDAVPELDALLKSNTTAVSYTHLTLPTKRIE